MMTAPVTDDVRLVATEIAVFAAFWAGDHRPTFFSRTGPETRTLRFLMGEQLLEQVARLVVPLAGFERLASLGRVDDLEQASATGEVAPNLGALLVGFAVVEVSADDPFLHRLHGGCSGAPVVVLDSPADHSVHVHVHPGDTQS